MASAWFIDGDRGVWTLDTAGNTTQKAGADSALDLSVGADGTSWIISTETRESPGGNIISWYDAANNSWVQVPPLAAAAQVAGAPDGNSWVINTQGTVWTVYPQGGYKLMSPEGVYFALDISVGADGTVWIISSETRQSPGGNIISWYDAANNNWVQVPPLAAAAKVAGAPDGNAWVVNSKGEVWIVYPQGGYKLMSTADEYFALDISVGSDGTPWIISTDTGEPDKGGNRIKYCDTATGQWVTVPNAEGVKVAGV